jgi:hypothetical protein
MREYDREHRGRHEDPVVVHELVREGAAGRLAELEIERHLEE